MEETGRGWLGNVSVAETQNGLAVGVVGGRGGGRTALVPFDTPLYAASIDFGDTIRTIDGQPASIAAWNAISAKRPGDRVTFGIVRRDGAAVTRQVTLRQDPTALQIVPVDSPTPAQREFQQRWLASGVR
jgi:C-terminal processing protease CtpA/Prc